MIKLFSSLFLFACSYCFAMVGPPNAGVEIFFHDTVHVPPIANAVNTARAINVLSGVPAVNSTQNYAGGGVYAVGDNVMHNLIAVPVLTLQQKAMMAVERFAFGIRNHNVMFHMPDVFIVAVGAIGGIGVNQAAQFAAERSLDRGGYSTFSAAFLYSCTHIGVAWLPWALQAVGNANIWIGVHLQRRVSKNIKEIHWNSCITPLKVTIKNLINALRGNAPNSATLIYYDNNSFD